MIDLLIDTNVLIHLLHPTSNAEAGLTRQLLDWDKAGHVRMIVASASGQEQGRSREQLVDEIEALGLSSERIVDVEEHSSDLLSEISSILGHRKAGDGLDAQIIYSALVYRQQGHDVWLVTGDRNILRYAEALQAHFGQLQIINLRGAVNQLKVEFPLTIKPKYKGIAS